jgi:two-component system OmpR family sensor kinase
MSWGLTAVVPSVWFDANVRAHIADDVAHTAQRLQNDHKTPTQVAQAIVTLVRSVPGFTVAVYDDEGKLLAGDPTIGNLPYRPFGFERAVAGTSPPPAPGPTLIPANLGFHGTVFAMRPAGAPTRGLSLLRWPLGELSVPTSFVRIDGGLVLFRPTQDVVAAVQNLSRGLAMSAIFLTFVAVLLLGRRLFASSIRPLDRLRSGLLRLAHGDHARLETFDPDDGSAAELVAAYNAVASEMQSAARQRAEVEAKIRQFVADAGHELRTPLAVIMGYVQLLRQSGQADGEMAARVFSEIDEQGKRMSVLIQKLLLLTRLESQEPHDVKILDASDVAESVVASFRPLANGARLTVDAQRDAFVQVSESELHEAIGNLIDNALKYAPGSHIQTRVRVEGDSVVIAVADDGPGMSPEVRARAFERFSRGELSGSITGAGLGLAIVERAVERAGGSVRLQSAPGQGTTVELCFPAWQHAGAQTALQTPR